MDDLIEEILAELPHPAPKGQQFTDLDDQVPLSMRLPADQLVEILDDAKYQQPLHPLCGPFTGWASHLLGILVPKEAFNQRPVEALHNALVPVDVNPSSPNLDRVLCQQLTHCTHELAPRVNLKELRPPQGGSACKPELGHLRPLPQSC